MKVVLVLPPFDMAARLGSANLTRKNRGLQPSLGVGHLASYLETHGHDVALVDAQVKRWRVPETADAILEASPDIIGISCMSIYAQSTYRLVEEIKARAPDIPVVMGGPHATCFFDTILEDCPAIDLVIPGEAEISFTELVDRLDKGQPYDDVQALVYRNNNGHVVVNPPGPLVSNLDELPRPARHIFEHDLYRPLPDQRRREPSTTVITSRGCPWSRCKFCYHAGAAGVRYRRRSPENVMAEIRYLVKELGFREINFLDDLFTGRPSWTERFCDLLDRQKLDITWAVLGRADMVTEDILKRMARSGCYNIYFGLESGNQKLLDLLGKGFTLDQARSAVKWAKRAGMEIRASFMLGLPTETPEMGEETLRFACELNVDWVIFWPFRNLPRTPIEEFAAAHGKVLEEVTMHSPAYLPDTYSDVEQLERLVRSAYRRYYLRPRYIARALWEARRPMAIRNYLASFLYWVDLLRAPYQSS